MRCCACSNLTLLGPSAHIGYPDIDIDYYMQQWRHENTPMIHNDVDRSIAAAERDAAFRHIEFPDRRSEEIERMATGSSTSSDHSHPHGAALNRVETQRDLERHQTELSRIQTAKSQHSATVGRDARGLSLIHI